MESPTYHYILFLSNLVEYICRLTRSLFDLIVGSVDNSNLQVIPTEAIYEATKGSSNLPTL